MKYHYWAVRPTGSKEPVRIERALTPKHAADLAFGRGAYAGIWQAKDLGTRVATVRSAKQLQALLASPEGWIDPYLMETLAKYGLQQKILDMGAKR